MNSRRFIHHQVLPQAAFFAALATTSLVPALARAQEPIPARAENAWHLEAGVGTDFPIQVGLRAGLETPQRIRLSTSLGVLPRPYVNAVNGVLVGAGAYDRVTGDVIKDTLSSSLVWRTHVGFRPFANSGFYVDVGYGLVALGGGTTAAALLAELTGQTLPQGHSDLDVSVHSTLHMFDVEFGWRIPLSHSFVVWAALGGAFTFASSTRLSVQPTGDADFDQAARQLAGTGANYLDHVYRSYVFTPVISLGGSYVFF